MPDIYNIKRGLDIPVNGNAPLSVNKMAGGPAAVCPGDFKGFAPRLLVKEGDRVLAGSPVVSDKNHSEILLTAPLSGTVSEIGRGERRKLLAIVIEPDGLDGKAEFPKRDPSSLNDAQVREALLESGLWPFLVQRPYGTIADPSVTPKAIFISMFSTAPLAADTEFTLGPDLTYIQAAVTALGKTAPVHLSVNSDDSAFAGIKGAYIHVFKGKHPAGNVGVQISHVSPICKGDIVWTVSPEGLAAIGKLLLEGRYDVQRKVAVCGPAAEHPAYVEALPGASLTQIAGLSGSAAEGLRIVSGNLLSGTSHPAATGRLGFFHNQVTVLKEGTRKELLGWMRPLRLNQFSADRTYFSWCLGKGRRYDMDTNLHGGPRAFVMPDSYYSKVLPMDIYPVYLVKACLAGDIDKMEKFGIYEVLPEDLALCEFIDPSKNYIQDIVAKGIDLMLKEMT
ncbi:MAG: Na(+)-translocating NADH-quinone reductase subunit A [Bacteroidales bacterium]|nr:Na(+)-translocating NADH-quinone reductase subunit A [Bacteroidales bacterium]